MTITAFDPTPDPEFARAVQDFPWQPWEQSGIQIGSVAVGTCPHCGHRMAVYRRRVRALRTPSTITATCNCVEPHTSRPDGLRQGCGQSVLLDLTTWDPSFRTGGPR